MEINRNNYESRFLDYYEGTLSAEEVAALFLFLEQNSDLRTEFEEFEIIHLPENESSSFTFINKQSLHKEELSDDEIRERMLDNLEGNANHELKPYLSARPHLQKEWNDLQKTILIPSNESFSAKTSLKKNQELPAGYDQLLLAELEGDLQLSERVKLRDLLQQYPALAVERELLRNTKLQPEKVVFAGKESLKKRTARVITLQTRIAMRIAASLILLIGAWYVMNREELIQPRMAENPAAPVVAPQNISDKKQIAIPAEPQVTPGTSAQVADDQKTQKQHRAKSNVQAAPQYAEVQSPKNESPSPAGNGNAGQLQDISPMEMLAANIPEEEPFVFPERRRVPVITSAPVATVPATITPGEILNEMAETVNKVTEETPLAAETNGTKLTAGSRIIRTFAWIVGKASDDRIRIKTTFDPLNGNLAAYEVETPNRKWQKQF
jgi:hypothetical protein